MTNEKRSQPMTDVKTAQLINRVSVEKLTKLLLSTLRRDSQRLAEGSIEGPLTDKQAATLIAYIKLAKELKKAEDAELAALSDEALAKRAK